MTYIKHIQVSNFNFDGPLNKRFPGYKDDWIKIALSLLESDSTQKMLSSAILLIGACYKKCFNVPCNFFKKVIGQQNILIWIRSTAKKCTFGMYCRCKNLYFFHMFPAIENTSGLHWILQLWQVNKTTMLKGRPSDEILTT